MYCCAEGSVEDFNGCYPKDGSEGCCSEYSIGCFSNVASMKSYPGA